MNTLSSYDETNVRFSGAFILVMYWSVDQPHSTVNCSQLLIEIIVKNISVASVRDQPDARFFHHQAYELSLRKFPVNRPCNHSMQLLWPHQFHAS